MGTFILDLFTCNRIGKIAEKSPNRHAIGYFLPGVKSPTGVAQQQCTPLFFASWNLVIRKVAKMLFREISTQQAT